LEGGGGEKGGRGKGIGREVRKSASAPAIPSEGEKRNKEGFKKKKEGRSISPLTFCSPEKKEGERGSSMIKKKKEKKEKLPIFFGFRTSLLFSR